MTDVRTTALEQAREELFDHRIYSTLARREEDPGNRRALEELAEQERAHADFWLSLTDGAAPRATRIRHACVLATTRLFGLAFTIRWLERGERDAVERYQQLIDAGDVTGDEARRLEQIIRDELGHEQILEDRLADERKAYLGAAVLGLNDALVELTGGLTGLASSIADTTLIAFSGLVVGIAAAFSMAASNFLSVDIGEPQGESEPVKAAAYTGTAYLLAVLVLVAPFFVFTERMQALVATWSVAVLIITGFAFYSAVLQERSFARRFGQMLLLGLGVAVITFGIGKAIGAVLGVDVS